METPLDSAPDIAVEALRHRSSNLWGRLRRLLSGSRLSAGERALAAELALGTIRAVLGAFLDRPDRRLPTPLDEILYVGLYRLLFLDREPSEAPADEAADQAVRHHHKRQNKLVRGVLRTVAKNVSPLTEGPPPLAPDVVPVAPGAYRTAGRDVFPDPQASPAAYLAADLGDGSRASARRRKRRVSPRR